MFGYLEGIEGAAEDEQAVVSQRGNHAQVSGVANEVDLADAGVVMDHLQRQRRKRGSDETLFANRDNSFLKKTAKRKYVTNKSEVGSSTI